MVLFSHLSINLNKKFKNEYFSKFTRYLSNNTENDFASLYPRNESLLTLVNTFYLYTKD